MKPRIVLAAALLVSLAGIGGFLAYQDGLVPLPLADGRERFVPGKPEFGEDAIRLEILMPAGPGLEALLTAQSDLALIEPAPGGGWAGQLLSGLQVSRHGRRWRLTFRPGWRMQDGASLDATRAAQALRTEVSRLGGDVRVVDADTLDLRFKARPDGLPSRLTLWRVPGTGPFIRHGSTLTRFEGFTLGRASVAALVAHTDPALLESHAWAQGLASARWAWTVFPGGIAPEDMAKVRMAPYDELRMRDGTVWFISRRMRRLRPEADDWTRTRLFGVWKGAMDLPYDPLGM